MLYRVSIEMYGTDDGPAQDQKKAWCRQELGRRVFDDLSIGVTYQIELWEEIASLALVPETEAWTYIASARCT